MNFFTKKSNYADNLYTLFYQIGKLSKFSGKYDNHHTINAENNIFNNTSDLEKMITKEKDSNKCLIKSSIGNYYTSESLKDVFKRLDNRFVRINRSCIINGDKVEEYDFNSNKITMKSGLTSFDVSRENKKDFFSRIIDKK